MTQLNRLAGEVNISTHEPSSSIPLGPPDDDKSDKLMDIKLHSASAVVHIRYGTNPQQETKRLLKHAKKVSLTIHYLRNKINYKISIKMFKLNYNYVNK